MPEVAERSVVEADLLDALLVVVLGWESGPLDKLTDELDRKAGGQVVRDLIDNRVEDLFGRKLVASHRDICDEYETYPTKAGTEFVKNVLRAAIQLAEQEATHA